jgi:hypothetical protein
MRNWRWQVTLAVALVVFSAVLYVIHFELFHDSHHIFIYMLGDVAFVPIEVLLVTLIIHRLLSAREKKVKLQKLNMVIGAFYSEVGSTLLEATSERDPDLDNVRRDLIITGAWSDRKFKEVSKKLRGYAYTVDLPHVKLADLRDFLTSKRDFMVRLLENPLLLDHESFTRLLRAVFHFTEELEAREDLKKLPESDLDHLAGDAHRAYRLLVLEWLCYMKYLKDTHPYLFSLAMRTNPFDRASTPVVT